MSFLKRLFGGGSESREEEPAKTIEYNGFSIQATPFVEEGQFQTCGIISKDVEGTRKEHRFVRADRFASKDAAVDTAIRKAQQIIDEQGDRIFS